MLPSPAQVGALYALMPAFLERALLPFQREGVRFGLARGGRCLIADEMGVVGWAAALWGCPGLRCGGMSRV